MRQTTWQDRASSSVKTFQNGSVHRSGSLAGEERLVFPAAVVSLLRFNPNVRWLAWLSGSSGAGCQTDPGLRGRLAAQSSGTALISMHAHETATVERRMSSSSDDQAELWWQMLEGKRSRFVNRWWFNAVILTEAQRSISGQFAARQTLSDSICQCNFVTPRRGGCGCQVWEWRSMRKGNRSRARHDHASIRKAE